MIDQSRLAAHIAMMTGHAQGTVTHETILQRVVTDLEKQGTAKIRDDARSRTFILVRSEFDDDDYGLIHDRDEVKRAYEAALTVGGGR